MPKKEALVSELSNELGLTIKRYIHKDRLEQNKLCNKACEKQVNKAFRDGQKSVSWKHTRPEELKEYRSQLIKEIIEELESKRFKEPHAAAIQFLDQGMKMAIAIIKDIE